MRNTPSLSEIYSGRYTPVVTKVTNITIDPTIYEFFYSKNGDMVTVMGQIIIDVDSAVYTEANLTIPIPSSFSSVNTDAFGTVVAVSSSSEFSGHVIASIADGEVAIGYISTVSGAIKVAVNFSYKII